MNSLSIPVALDPSPVIGRDISSYCSRSACDISFEQWWSHGWPGNHIYAETLPFCGVRRTIKAPESRLGLTAPHRGSTRVMDESGPTAASPSVCKSEGWPIAAAIYDTGGGGVIREINHMQIIIWDSLIMWDRWVRNSLSLKFKLWTTWIKHLI